MANIRWIGGATKVAQVDTFTPGGTIEADDIFILTATGWDGVLPVKPLRDWLKVTDPCIMDIAVYRDKIEVLADNTLAIFRITGINDFTPGKNILAYIPLNLE